MTRRGRSIKIPRHRHFNHSHRPAGTREGRPASRSVPSGAREAEARQRQAATRARQRDGQIGKASGVSLRSAPPASRLQVCPAPRLAAWPAHSAIAAWGGGGLVGEVMRAAESTAGRARGIRRDIDPADVTTCARGCTAGPTPRDIPFPRLPRHVLRPRARAFPAEECVPGRL
jgi:hypothetical protein